jgi:hydrogenase expression/formation protein HypC
MCLAIPARIVELDGHDAVVEVGGVRRKSNVSFITDAKVGDCVLLHAGFAIQKWTDEDLQEYNEIVTGILRARDDKDEG